MDTRKVQKTGGASYSITLPKDWVESRGVKKNDRLELYAQPDGTLLVTTISVKRQLQPTKEFDVDSINEPLFLFRLLVGAYIAGYTTIKLKSKRRMPPFVRTVVRDFTRRTISQEVIEETDTSIVIKDLLNPVELPFDNTLKRMHNIVRGMHEDAIRALETGNLRTAEEVISRDNDVNRLNWLVEHQYNLILGDISLPEKMGVTVRMATDYFLMSRIMERIGDHAVRIAKNIQNVTGKDVDRKIISNIKSASGLSLNIFSNSIKSFFEKDAKASNTNIEAVKELESLCEKINTQALKQSGEVAVSIGYIAESIRRVGEYSSNISENVIDHIVAEKG
ncbi:MAG: phosphate uptake regulator PhoU [Candidatus Altiarchaeota archaeon]